MFAKHTPPLNYSPGQNVQLLYCDICLNSQDPVVTQWLSFPHLQSALGFLMLFFLKQYFGWNQPLTGELYAGVLLLDPDPSP